MLLLRDILRIQHHHLRSYLRPHSYYSTYSRPIELKAHSRTCSSRRHSWKQTWSNLAMWLGWTQCGSMAAESRGRLSFRYWATQFQGGSSTNSQSRLGRQEWRFPCALLPLHHQLLLQPSVHVMYGTEGGIRGWNLPMPGLVHWGGFVWYDAPCFACLPSRRSAACFGIL